MHNIIQSNDTHHVMTLNDSLSLSLKIYIIFTKPTGYPTLGSKRPSKEGNDHLDFLESGVQAIARTHWIQSKQSSPSLQRPQPNFNQIRFLAYG